MFFVFKIVLKIAKAYYLFFKTLKNCLITCFFAKHVLNSKNDLNNKNGNAYFKNSLFLNKFSSALHALQCTRTNQVI